MPLTTTLRTLLLTCGLGLPLAAQAQAEFHPGYIVPTAGDTVRGEIDYRDARFNNAQCRFRPATAPLEARTYLPSELLAYGLPAEAKQFRRLTPPGSSAPVFAEVLVSGPASLYTLRDTEGTDHYYLDAPQFALTELVSLRTMVPDQPMLREDPRYRFTLQQAMPNCPAAEALLPHLPFTAAALRRVVITFNACQGVATAPSVPVRARQRARAGVVLGGMLTSAVFHYTNDFLNNQTLDYGTSGSYALGLSAELPLTAISRRLTLVPYLLVAQQQHELTLATGPAAGRYTLKATYLRLPLLLRYTLPNGTVRPFAELGPTLALALNLRNQMGSLAANAPAPKDFYSDTQHSLEEGVAAGLGVRFPYAGGRLASLGVRAELNTGWMEALGFNSRVTRLFGLLALDLTK